MTSQRSREGHIIGKVMLVSKVIIEGMRETCLASHSDRNNRRSGVHAALFGGSHFQTFWTNPFPSTTERNEETLTSYFYFYGHLLFKWLTRQMRMPSTFQKAILSSSAMKTP
ncbi:Hypothetical predicted protein [Octopus vulgaris]|uniref:Uncharacterized protein n=1 Tax=Octopus vulgaris TaxID=6645 RepID=A0AA36BNA4_OCTVU|nr:Hypothetical predicted protein [Octopus vulgaris]